MRMTLLFATCSALILTSCEARFDWPWLDKEGSTKAIETTGQVTTQDRAVSSFSKVVLNGVGKLIFDPTVPSGTIRITADEGVLPAVQTTVSDGTLTIAEDGLQSPDSWGLEFRLAPPEALTEVRLDGVGSIEASSPVITAAELTVVIQGMGKVELQVNAPKVLVYQKGSGELVLKGSAGAVSVVAQGLGRVDVSELITTSAEVTSQGVGEVNVYASEKLKVRAQGLGAVHFYGNPATTDVQTEGLTQVKAAD